jgi:hypothetical protein
MSGQAMDDPQPTSVIAPGEQGRGPWESDGAFKGMDMGNPLTYDLP